MNPKTGEEIWPGAWHRLLFSSYDDLALEIDSQTLKPKPTPLVTTGIAEQALQRDFYRPILKTLTEYGGYVKTQSGSPAQAAPRRLYIFAYDWRLDIVDNVRALDQLIRAIQRDYGNPAQHIHAVQLEKCWSTYMQEFTPNQANFELDGDRVSRLSPVLEALLQTMLDWKPE